VILFSHLTYFVQLIYLGKLSLPKYHKYGLKLLIFQCYNTRTLNAKLSLYYFTYLIFNKWHISAGNTSAVTISLYRTAPDILGVSLFTIWTKPPSAHAPCNTLHGTTGPQWHWKIPICQWNMTLCDPEWPLTVLLIKYDSRSSCSHIMSDCCT